MAVKSQGRGVAAAFGLFLLFAGLVGGGVLYVVAERRPAQSVEGFARAPIGCTTTLDFTDTGTFYVYEEVGTTGDVTDGTCQPVAVPSATFAVEFFGDPTPGDIVDDASVSYDVDGFDGRSIQRVEIVEPGQYSLAVSGDDLTVVAALGRDPDDGVEGLRRAAVIVAAGGAILGLLLLILSGRRSKKAATVATPQGPGWATTSIVDSPGGDDSWPPKAPTVDQVPINPHQPPEPAGLPDPAPPAPSAPQPPGGPWGPPSGAATEAPAPAEPTTDEPTLPDSQGRVSGT